VVSDHVQRIIHKVDRLEFSTETEAAYPENPISERPHPILDEAFLNVTNMGIRCSFPTFTRKDILDITIKSDRAAAAMAQAVEADHPNNESVAIAAYIDAIKKITQVEGHSSPAICQLLYGIAGIYPKPPLFDYSISIYRQVVIETAIREGTTQEPRTESVLKIVAMEGLAKSLLRFRQYEEAELKFCEASELFRKAGYQKHSFDCRFWRARTLQEIERDNEALPLLYSVLVYRLEHTSTTSEILDVALALGKAYKNLRENRYGISTWLANFIHVAEISPNQLYDIDKCSCGSIIIDALINLADKLSLMGDFETANSIIRVAIAKTSGWALDHDSKFKQANCNYIYGKILFRQGSYSAAAEYLIVALTILMSIGEDDGPLPARARERLALSAVELGKLVNTDHSQIIDAITAIETLLIERNGQLFQDASTSVVPNVPDLITLGQEDRSQDESEGKLTAAALQRQDGVTLDKWGSSENELEVRTTTTRSYKYGVTFSVSDITGISLSEFFVS
jgi:tetratricopeptide (TPR) repeat protein